MSFTLSATDTLNAKAGTNTAITYTLLGDAIASGVDSFKNLGQGQLTTSASTPIYPATAGTQTIIREIQFANTTGSDVTGVTLYINGSAAANQVSAGFTIPANGSAGYRDGLFTIYSATGLPISTSSVTLTGDVTGSGAGTIATTLKNTGPGATGPLGSASTTPVVTIDAQGRTTALTSATITPAAIGAPSGSGISSGTNTGDQTITLTGDTTGSGTGSFATINAKLQGTAVSSTVPLIGQNLEYGPTSWTGATNYYNVIDFGATPDTSTDSTLAFYNAIISCGIQRLASKQWTLTAQGMTTSTTFSLTVTANAAASSTGNILMQTTSGLVYASYTGGTTTTLACTWVAGVPGGLVLNGSIVGVPSTAQIGGTVRIPAGIYYTSREITNSIPGIHFEGDGGGFFYGAGNWTMLGGSWIYYNGSTNGAALRNVPLTGANGPYAGQSLGGIRVTGVNVQGNQLAAHGISMISCGGMYMEDCYIEECILEQYEFTTLANNMLGGTQTTDNHRGTVINCNYDSSIGGTGTTTQIAAANVNQIALTSNINTLSNTTMTIVASPGTINAAWASGAGFCRIQAIDTVSGTARWYLASYTAASGTTITGVTTLGLYPNQSNVTTANATTPPTGASALPSALLFSGSLIQPATGPFANGARLHGAGSQDTCCITFINFNGNYFVGTGVDVGATDSNIWIDSLEVQVSGVVGLTSYGFEFQGAKNTIFNARNNHIFSGSPGIGGVNVRGTNSYGYTNPAGPNIWDGYQVANGEPRPTVGTGANFQVTYNGAMRPTTDNRVSAATGNAATVGGAGTAVTGLLPNMYVIIPTQGAAVGTTVKFTVVLTKTAAGTSVQFGLKFGTTNSASDTTVATGTAYTGTAAAETMIYEVLATFTAVGSGTSASIQAYAAPLRRSLTEAAITGWVSTVAAFNVVQTWAPTGFNSTVTNPGPAYLGLYALANTGTIITVSPGSMVEVIAA